MEDSIEFIKFDETPKEQKVLGFATIRKTYVLVLNGKNTNVVQYERFKLTRNDKGGYFIQAPSIKADSDPGENIFVSSNEYDSKFITDTIHAIIRAGYKKHTAGPSVHITPAVDTKTQTAQVEDVELPF